MRYFESPNHRSRRWPGYDHCFIIADTAPFVGVWNRFVERWKEIEGDRGMPQVLHQRTFAGAKLFTLGNVNVGTGHITHPNFLVQMFFRPGKWRYAERWSCCHTPITPSDLLAVECHYKASHREAVFAWLAAEHERFACGKNSYDT